MVTDAGAPGSNEGCGAAFELTSPNSRPTPRRWSPTSGWRASTQSPPTMPRSEGGHGGAQRPWRGAGNQTLLGASQRARPTRHPAPPPAPRRCTGCCSSLRRTRASACARCTWCPAGPRCGSPTPAHAPHPMPQRGARRAPANSLRPPPLDAAGPAAGRRPRPPRAPAGNTSATPHSPAGPPPAPPATVLPAPACPGGRRRRRPRARGAPGGGARPGGVPRRARPRHLHARAQVRRSAAREAGAGPGLRGRGAGRRDGGGALGAQSSGGVGAGCGGCIALRARAHAHRWWDRAPRTAPPSSHRTRPRAAAAA